MCETKRVLRTVRSAVLRRDRVRCSTQVRLTFSRLLLECTREVMLHIVNGVRRLYCTAPGVKRNEIVEQRNQQSSAMMSVHAEVLNH